MNRQTFNEYLEQPSKLYQLSLTELQGLVLEYPYSANLRQLLLLKAKLESHPHAADMLQQAAARTFDRGHLYDLLQELERDGLESLGQQEKLELQDLDKLEFELMPASTVAETESPLASSSDIYPIDEPALPNYPEQEVAVENYEEEKIAEDDDDDEIGPNDLPEPTVTSVDEELEVGDIIDLSPVKKTDLSTHAKAVAVEQARSKPYLHDLSDAAAISDIVARWHSDIVPPAPAPLEQFTSSAPRRASRLADRLKKHKQLQLAQLDRPEPEDQVEEIARQSVAAQREVASETLAQLLERQGQYGKAIKMYQRLSLLYPEKKPIFAGLIKNLKEKL